MFERYTEKARRVIFFARYEASLFGSPQIGTEHLLLGMIREDDKLLLGIFGSTGAVGKLRQSLESRKAKREGIGASVELPLSPESNMALAYACEESDRLADRHIGTEHLLLGLLRTEGSTAEIVLRENGLTLERARAGVGRDVECASPDVNDSEDVTQTMRVEHIGIATPKIDEALKFWRDALGLEVRHTEVVEEQGVRVAMLPVGEPRVELLEPTGPDSPVAKFLEKRGPGIHHVAVRVADIRAALARLKGAGARLIDEEPRVGAGGCLVAFVHPAAAGGVLLELVEHTAAGGEEHGSA
jgi:methylmalonyl-CoA/ethylmalonyl-CoA epimerase